MKHGAELGKLLHTQYFMEAELKMTKRERGENIEAVKVHGSYQE